MKGRWAAAAAWSKRNRRLVAVLSGVALVAVPTFFTVVPGWAKWHGGARAVVLVIWVGIAAAVVRAATARDERLEAVTADRHVQRVRVRKLTLEKTLESLLRPGTHSIPRSFAFTVYVFDEDKELLKPVWPPRDRPAGTIDPREFAPGKGCTGMAWSEQRLFRVRGADVTNNSYGLTEAQRSFYAGSKAVASTVIPNDVGDRLGVLTAISSDDDGHFHSSPGADALRTLAEVVGVVLTAVPSTEDGT